MVHCAGIVQVNNVSSWHDVVLDMWGTSLIHHSPSPLWLTHPRVYGTVNVHAGWCGDCSPVTGCDHIVSGVVHWHVGLGYDHAGDDGGSWVWWWSGVGVGSGCGPAWVVAGYAVVVINDVIMAGGHVICPGCGDGVVM